MLHPIRSAVALWKARRVRKNRARGVCLDLAAEAMTRAKEHDRFADWWANDDTRIGQELSEASRRSARTYWSRQAAMTALANELAGFPDP